MKKIILLAFIYLHLFTNDHVRFFCFRCVLTVFNHFYTVWSEFLLSGLLSLSNSNNQCVHNGFLRQGWHPAVHFDKWSIDFLFVFLGHNSLKNLQISTEDASTVKYHKLLIPDCTLMLTCEDWAKSVEKEGRICCCHLKKIPWRHSIRDWRIKSS